MNKNLEIIYHNGQADGIRSVRKKLSTITAHIIPRPLINEAKKITHSSNPGIYFLIDENDENTVPQLYIGQTRNGVCRLDNHNRTKDFWSKAIMFLADKTTFTLDMISGLEMYAIMKAHEAKRYNVVNSVKPKFKINEYDLPLVKEVYEEIEFTMATQGFKMDNAKTNLSSADNFQTTRNGIVAYGIYSGDKFEVMEGSQIDFSRKPYLEKYELQRIELLKNGNIINKAGNYILNTTLDFNTPSGAAEFVLGGAANGWVEWKNKDSKTLDEIFRK